MSVGIDVVQIDGEERVRDVAGMGVVRCTDCHAHGCPKTEREVEAQPLEASVDVPRIDETVPVGVPKVAMSLQRAAHITLDSALLGLDRLSRSLDNMGFGIEGGTDRSGCSISRARPLRSAKPTITSNDIPNAGDPLRVFADVIFTNQGSVGWRIRDSSQICLSVFLFLLCAFSIGGSVRERADGRIITFEVKGDPKVRQEVDVYRHCGLGQAVQRFNCDPKVFCVSCLLARSTRITAADVGLGASFGTEPRLLCFTCLPVEPQSRAHEISGSLS